MSGCRGRSRKAKSVGRDGLERTIQGRETAEARYFDAWRGLAAEDGHYLHDLVRRTGSADETPDDLGWQRTGVLGRLEPSWWVEELGERGFRTSRYVAAIMGRAHRFRGQTHDYQAVFHKEDDVYDFGNVLFLARRLPNPYELEYERWTPDGWQPVSGMLLGYRTFPISEEEFHRLAARRPDERGVGDLTP